MTRAPRAARQRERSPPRHALSSSPKSVSCPPHRANAAHAEGHATVPHECTPRFTLKLPSTRVARSPLLAQGLRVTGGGCRRVTRTPSLACPPQSRAFYIIHIMRHLAYAPQRIMWYYVNCFLPLPPHTPRYGGKAGGALSAAGAARATYPRTNSRDNATYPRSRPT